VAFSHVVRPKRFERPTLKAYILFVELEINGNGKGQHERNDCQHHGSCFDDFFEPIGFFVHFLNPDPSFQHSRVARLPALP
jgi:hypothetical protein